jgi:hypothetical protein
VANLALEFRDFALLFDDPFRVSEIVGKLAGFKTSGSRVKSDCAIDCGGARVRAFRRGPTELLHNSTLKLQTVASVSSHNTHPPPTPHP